jgi:biphenyl-2,3-diol 1,2-dioxygenase
MADLYVNEFGFRVSDHIDWDDAHATFLHCNPRHHSLALVNECFGMKGGQVHHMMIETTSLDDVGRAYDLIRKNGIPLALTLGRHTNDHMTSFYCGSPSGFAIEYGWGGRLIDDAVWQAGQYDSPSIWGHEFMG